jgi:hypothetical protein
MILGGLSLYSHARGRGEIRDLWSIAGFASVFGNPPDPAALQRRLVETLQSKGGEASGPARRPW